MPLLVIMKPIIYTLIFFFSLAAFGQEKQYSKEVILLDDSNKYLMLIRNENQQIIYSGAFDTQQALPIGSHYYYGQSGKVKHLIEYSFSGEYFETVPVVFQTSYVFNENQKLEKVIRAQRCTECEYSPIGVWEFYKDGKLEKAINADKTLTLIHKEYEIYWDLLENCK